MPPVRMLLRATRSHRALAIAIGFAVCALGEFTFSVIDHSRAQVRELRWLRVRLAEKRDLIARQREEMTAVAAEVDRLTRTSLVTRERAAEARRLASMGESRDTSHDVSSITPTLDGRDALVSEEGGRALEQLGWLNVQASTVGDSLAILTALLRDRTEEVGEGMPSVWPVRGLITSAFGQREDPYGEGREMHPGVDIQARYGTPVVASASGEVIFAGHDSGYGTLVILDHGRGVQTLYGHLSAMYVYEGQRIRRGQPVGAIGASGRATGAHLHYEMRVLGGPVDPAPYLGVDRPGTRSRSKRWAARLVSAGSR